MTLIDTHAHFIPAAFVKRIRDGHGPDGVRIEDRADMPWVVHRQGYAYPLPPHFFDSAARLNKMTQDGVTTAVLSVPPTFFFYGTSTAEAVDTARMLNDSLADSVRAGDGRLSAVATLPMQDADAAVVELKRAVTELGLKGAEIGPNVEGKPLDSTDIDRVLQTAATLGVPLLVHPYYVGSSADLKDFYMTNLLGNPWQTTVCATRLVLSGTLDRLPELKVLLVHGGGYLVQAAGRLDHGYKVRSELTRIAAPPSEYLRRFYYDTLTHDHVALGRLVESVGDDRVVFGSDAPFDMGNDSFDEHVGSVALADAARQRVMHENAEALFSLGKVTKNG